MLRCLIFLSAYYFDLLKKAINRSKSVLRFFINKIKIHKKKACTYPLRSLYLYISIEMGQNLLKRMEWISIINIIEIIGIFAAAFILLSFLCNGERQIRIVNTIGAVLFVIYGILINALSVYLMNGILIIVHIRKLFKLKKESSQEEKT